MIKMIARLAREIRWWTPAQLTTRLRLGIDRELPIFSRCPRQPDYDVQIRTLRLASSIASRECWLGDQKFRFQGQTARVVGWDASMPMLWRYHLHYFDWLRQDGVGLELAIRHIMTWIRDNPPRKQPAWHPFPTSLRLVNWLKWVVEHADLINPAELRVIERSIVRQGHHLLHRIEWDASANHLLANATALVWVGGCFDGTKGSVVAAAGDVGTSLLQSELDSQIFPDGGHSERSPMYHAQVTEWVLDCLNLFRSGCDIERGICASIAATSRRMLECLVDVLHPDAKIPFFNDADFGQGPDPTDLLEYAERMGVTVAAPRKTAIRSRPNFGVHAMQCGPLDILVYSGEPSPRNAAGHTHCALSSFELSVDGRRWFVNRGTYQYAGPQRSEFRGTAAHNVLQVEKLEQHDVWSSFRVGRRAKSFDLRCVESPDGTLEYGVGHDGFAGRDGTPIVRRQIKMKSRMIHFLEQVTGTRLHRVSVHLHLHPDVSVVELACDRVLMQCGRRQLVVSTSSRGVRIRSEMSTWSPNFGELRVCTRLVLERLAASPFNFEWSIQLVPLVERPRG